MRQMKATGVLMSPRIIREGRRRTSKTEVGNMKSEQNHQA